MLRRTNALIARPHPQFNEDTFANDIAIIDVPPNTFSLSSVIPINFVATIPATGAIATIASYGPTVAGGPLLNQVANVAPQSILAACAAATNASTTHLCASDTTAVVCPGDNGSGLYVANVAGPPTDPPPGPTDPPTDPTDPPTEPPTEPPTLDPLLDGTMPVSSEYQLVKTYFFYIC